MNRHGWDPAVRPSYRFSVRSSGVESGQSDCLTLRPSTAPCGWLGDGGVRCSVRSSGYGGRVGRRRLGRSSPGRDLRLTHDSDRCLPRYCCCARRLLGHPLSLRLRYDIPRDEVQSVEVGPGSSKGPARVALIVRRKTGRRVRLTPLQRYATRDGERAMLAAAEAIRRAIGPH